MSNKITLENYWDWMQSYATILEDLVNLTEEQIKSNNDKGSFNSSFLPELRIAERSFNNFIDAFAEKVFIESKQPVTAYLQEKLGKSGIDEWNALKDKRDALAERISTLIELKPEYEKLYDSYCENLKKLRTLGSLL